jgi:hypothetical protein
LVLLAAAPTGNASAVIGIRSVSFRLNFRLSETPSIAVEKAIQNPTGRYSPLIFARDADYRNVGSALEKTAAQDLVHRCVESSSHHNIYPARKVYGL